MAEAFQNAHRISLNYREPPRETCKNRGSRWTEKKTTHRSKLESKRKGRHEKRNLKKKDRNEAKRKQQKRMNLKNERGVAKRKELKRMEETCSAKTRRPATSRQAKQKASRMSTKKTMEYHRHPQKRANQKSACTRQKKDRPSYLHRSHHLKRFPAGTFGLHEQLAGG
ncbi:UNVERIFIED_CONTAM: hypothetical protein HHA_449980 [Hammondia hammondi]|eukprot:XP_008882663.1 hypothetical protein HHA_449980 [Hammondia hammondi]